MQLNVGESSVGFFFLFLFLIKEVVRLVKSKESKIKK